MKIRVRSIPDKFRRAGIAFTKAPTEYDVDEKTLKILKTESQLVVEILPGEAPKEEDKKDKKDK
jgi:hypothetical protein